MRYAQYIIISYLYYTGVTTILNYIKYVHFIIRKAKLGSYIYYKNTV